MGTSDIINSIRNNITNAYNKLNEKGATLPNNKNIQNLASTIETVTTGGGSRLPSAYQEVEYIRVPQGQYIDTSYKPNNSTKIISTAIVEEQYAAVYGGARAWGSDDFSLSGQYLEFGNKVYNITLSLNTKLNLRQDSSGLYVDDTLVQTVEDATFTAPVSLFLGGSHNDFGEYGNDGNTKLYSAKIYENDSLLYNYIPCYRKSDNVIGVYDIVKKTFLTNGGTGTLEKGDDVHSGDEPNLQEKSVTITENTTTEITADSDYDGLSKVSITTNVAGGDGVSELTTISYLFYNNYRIDQFDDLKKLTWKGSCNMAFYMTSKDTIDLSNKDLSNLTSMSQMFQDARNVKYIDLSNTNTVNVTDMSNMFKQTNTLNSINLTNFNTSNVTNMSNMFDSTSTQSAISELDLSSFNTEKVVNMKSMFASSRIQKLNISSFNTSNVTNMSYMFYYIQLINELDISNLDTSNVTDMGYMFGLLNPKTIDLSTLNTSKVTNMTYMFMRLKNITTLDLSSFDTSSVTDISYMFQGCQTLTNIIGLNNFKGDNITTTYGMFSTCPKLTSVDLSSMETPKLTNVTYMFGGDTSLTHIDIRKFDFTNVKSYSNMFGASASAGVPNDCEIIVKDDTAKTWITSKFSRLTNVKTVAEL